MQVVIPFREVHVVDNKALVWAHLGVSDHVIDHGLNEFELESAVAQVRNPVLAFGDGGGETVSIGEFNGGDVFAALALGHAFGVWDMVVVIECQDDAFHGRELEVLVDQVDELPFKILIPCLGVIEQRGVELNLAINENGTWTKRATGGEGDRHFAFQSLDPGGVDGHNVLKGNVCAEFV